MRSLKGVPEVNELGSVNEVSWTVHPFRKHRLKSALLVVSLCAIALLVYWDTASTDGAAPFLMALVGTLLLAGAMRGYFFATGYRLTEEDVTIVTPFSKTTKQWSIFNSYSRASNGVLLSPFAERSRLENYRGLFLLFDDNGDRVMDFVKRKIVRSSDGGGKGR